MSSDEEKQTRSLSVLKDFIYVGFYVELMTLPELSVTVFVHLEYRYIIGSAPPSEVLPHTE